jgi:hypothetical protein
MNIKINYYFCISLIIFSLFFNFIRYDEAWIFNITENYSNYKSLITFHNEKIITNWTIYIKFLSKIYFKIDYINFFLLRIYSFLSIVFSFYLINIILKKYFINYKNYFFFSYFLFVYWFCFHDGGITSRPDSIVSALIVYFIFSIIEFKNNKIYIYSSSLLNIFSIIIHPNAIPLIFLNLLFILFFCFKKKIDFILILTLFLLLFLYFRKELIDLFFHYQYSTKNYYQGSTRDLLDFNLYIENIKKDILFQGRFRHLYNFYPFTFYILSFNYFLVFFYLIWIRDFKNKYFNFFLFLFFLWNAFFLLSPTKWAQHFAIIFALLCLMLPFLLFSLVEKFKLFLNIKTSSNIFKYFSLILILLISLKSLNYFHNNYFLYKLLGKYFEVNNYIFFNKLFKNEIVIQSVNDKMKNKNFYGNPEFKYVFNKANYLGNNSKKIKEEVEFFVVLSRNERCDDYEKLFNSKYILKTSFYMNDEIFIICEKSN